MNYHDDQPSRSFHKNIINDDLHRCIPQEEVVCRSWIYGLAGGGAGCDGKCFQSPHTGNEESGREGSCEEERKHDVKKILFVPYASRDHDGYAKKVKAALAKLDLQVESIHESLDPVQAIKNAEGIFIGGGNTFKLLKSLYDLELIEPIRSRVLKDGIPYMGASAGTNVATVTICTTNDMPIEYPPSFSALGFIPFNINPHYGDVDPNSTHMGESRDDRIKEYHEIPGMPPVLAMREGCILVVDDNKAVLTGIKGAKVFVINKDTTEYDVGSDVSFLLGVN